MTETTSQITVSMKPELSNSLLNVNAVKAGSILKLKIIELRGDRALIDFGKFRATADIKIPVSLGEELRVRVLESGPQLKMSVIGPESKNPLATDILPNRFEAADAERLQKVQSDVKQILNQAVAAQTDKPMPESILNILRRLNTYFEPINLTIDITKLISRLKASLENSGFFFEKSIENSILKSFGNSESLSPKQLADLPEVKHSIDRDLKANLTALKFLMEDKEALQKFFGPKNLATVNSSINSLLSDITHQQGRGEIAEKIIEIAKAHNLPLYEDRNLVQILEALELETEISPELYRAVAEVLAFIYRLNKA